MKEILHQLIGSLSYYLQGVIYPRWLSGISSINSMNCQQRVDEKMLAHPLFAPKNPLEKSIEVMMDYVGWVLGGSSQDL